VLIVLNVPGVLHVLAVLQGVGYGKRGMARRAIPVFTVESLLVAHLENGWILRSRLTAIIDPCRADIGVTQPCLDLSNNALVAAVARRPCTPNPATLISLA
jgi:hypothetical protein